jgi:dihydrofolate reductase
MKITLYTAISIDGFIAKSNGDSNWVNDDKYFEEAVNNCGAIVVGKTTYEQFYNEIYPMPNVLNIVLSTTKHYSENNAVTAKNTTEVIKIANEKNVDRVLVVGGGKVSASFIKENLVNEIILDIHPIILGKGINIFSNTEIEKNLKLVSTKTLDNDLVQVKYEVER